jgi:hypothetical protein
MQDSDDYFIDDFELDEEALAAIDREEQKYLHASETPAHRSSSPPPSKRQRTENDWNPGQRTTLTQPDDFEDLPEISVQSDGTYELGNSGKATQGDKQSFPGVSSTRLPRGRASGYSGVVDSRKSGTSTPKDLPVVSRSPTPSILPSRSTPAVPSQPQRCKALSSASYTHRKSSAEVHGVQPQHDAKEIDALRSRIDQVSVLPAESLDIVIQNVAFSAARGKYKDTREFKGSNGCKVYEGGRGHHPPQKYRKGNSRSTIFEKQPVFLWSCRLRKTMPLRS